MNKSGAWFLLLVQGPGSRCPGIMRASTSASFALFFALVLGANCLRTFPDSPESFLSLLLLSSGNAGSSSTNPAVTTRVVPPSFSSLRTDQSIVVTFSESMDPSSLSLGSAMGAEATAAWSSVDRASDRVTITPTTLWTLGQNRNLTAALRAADGESQNASMSFNVVNTVVYVSQSGNDANDGLSTATPKATLGAAIPVAAGVPPGAVQVAGSSSNTPYSITTAIPLMNGVTMRGGFSPDFTEQSGSSYPTRIRRTGATGTASIFTATNLAGSNNTVESFVLELDGVGASEQYVVDLNNSSLVFFGNALRAGSGGTGIVTSAGRVTGPGQVVFANNLMFTGSGAGITNNIAFSVQGGGGAGSITLINNYIVAGTATATADGVLIENTATPSAVHIINNTIVVAGSPNNRGIRLNASAPGIRRIRNNIITSSTCIHETSAPNDDPTFVDYNDLACVTQYFDEGTTAVSIAGSVNNGAVENLTTDLRNVAVAPQFQDATNLNLRLTASSPCSVTRGAIDLSSDYSINFDLTATTRTSSGGYGTTGWSMGAHESDGSCL